MKRFSIIVVTIVLLFSMISVNFVFAEDNNTYNFGFKKSKDGKPASIAQEGYMKLLKKYDSVFLGDINKKELYLTFDNGYENGYTNQILDILKFKDVQATFFLTGHYIKSEPELVIRMVNEGHIIGNHSWTHPDMSNLTDAKIEEELEKVKNEVIQLTGQSDMKYLRPPRGVFNEQTLAVSKKLGYTNVFWSIAYVDWDKNVQNGADYAYEKVMSQLHPGGVILLHAVSKDNAEALIKIIDDAREQGYEFKSLDQMEFKNYN